MKIPASVKKARAGLIPSEETDALSVFSLESDNFDMASDRVLNTLEREMLTFLQYNSAASVTKAILQRLQTHVRPELEYIRNEESDDISEFTSAAEFRKEFKQMGGIKI